MSFFNSKYFSIMMLTILFADMSSIDEKETALEGNKTML